VSLKEMLEERVAKRTGSDFRDVIAPPIRRIFSVMKTDASELARIAQNQGAPCLSEYKVIVFTTNKRGILDAQGSGHAQMNA
jgi:hypothetical protein